MPEVAPFGHFTLSGKDWNMNTMEAKSLKGIAVVSLNEGSQLGRVEEPLFDLAARQLRALEVRGDDGTFIVPFEQIVSIGSDAVTVTSSDVTHTPNAERAVGTLTGLHDLGKLKVVDDSGTFLGHLSSIEFDEQNGQVTLLNAHTGGLMGIGGTTTALDDSSKLVVGSDLLTVSTGDSGDPLTP
jgi:uncharacterized protein YrrD